MNQNAKFGDSTKAAYSAAAEVAALPARRAVRTGDRVEGSRLARKASGRQAGTCSSSKTRVWDLGFRG